jgi:hypothetical protein
LTGHYLDWPVSKAPLNAAGRLIVEQPKPLRAAAAPRADEHRPEAAAGKRPHPDADPVFDAVVAEPDKRRQSITPDVPVRHQGRHANQRQIFNSSLHEAETLCFPNQHSMCMIRSYACLLTHRVAVEPTPKSLLLLAWRPAPFEGAARVQNIVGGVARGGQRAGSGCKGSSRWRGRAKNPT